MRDDNLTDRIKRIKRELIAYKSAQPMAGDSLLAYNTSSSAQYDMTTTVPVFDRRDFRITFDYQSSLNGAIILFKPFYRVGNPNVMADPSSMYHPFAPEISMMIYEEPPTPTQSAWQLTVFNNSFIGTETVYLKFFFSGTDTGNWTVSAL